MLSTYSLEFLRPHEVSIFLTDNQILKTELFYLISFCYLNKCVYTIFVIKRTKYTMKGKSIVWHHLKMGISD